MTAIVTKETLKSMLENTNRDYAQKVIGRGLLVILNNQTEEEQCQAATKENNGTGFTGFDAKSGTLTALFYQKHKKLENWMMNKWLKTDKKGYPRLCKYHRQLNEAAEARIA